jgi:hypothetical protein
MGRQGNLKEKRSYNKEKESTPQMGASSLCKRSKHLDKRRNPSGR